MSESLHPQAGRARNSAILTSVVPSASQPFADTLSRFAMEMEKLDADPLSSVKAPVSFRQMLRTARRAAAYPGEVRTRLSLQLQ